MLSLKHRAAFLPGVIDPSWSRKHVEKRHVAAPNLFPSLSLEMNEAPQRGRLN